MGKYSTVSLKSLTGKIMEQIILKTMLRQMENKEVINEAILPVTKVQRQPEKCCGFL